MGERHRTGCRRPRKTKRKPREVPGARRKCWETGYTQGLDRMRELETREQSFTVRKAITNVGRKKTRTDLVVLDWDWRKRHELAVFNMYTDTEINTGVTTCVCRLSAHIQTTGFPTLH